MPKSVSNFGDAREIIANVRAVAFPLTVYRENVPLTINLTPRFYIFPYQSFAAKVEFNKFCDCNCDYTLDALGFLCATVYVYVGEGPNGGVLLQKICGSQESGLPRIDSICEVGEFI